MPTPTNRYWDISFPDGSTKKLPVPLSNACADRPTLAYVRTHASELISTPTLDGYALKAVNCQLPTGKIQEWYVARFNANALLLYAQGSGTLTVGIAGRNGTATPSPASKVMSTNESENQYPALFAGTKSHGVYFGSIANGDYALTITDADGLAITRNVTVTDTGPVTNLYRSTGTPTDPTVTVTGRVISGRSSVIEGMTDSVYSLRETLSDGSTRPYTGTVTWTLTNAPSGVTIDSTTGALPLPTGSITVSAQVKVVAHFGAAQSVELVVNLVDAATGASGGDGDYMPTTFVGELGYHWISTNPDMLQIRITSFNPATGEYTIENYAPNPRHGPVPDGEPWIEVDDSLVNITYGQTLNSFKFKGGYNYTVRTFVPYGGRTENNYEWNPVENSSVSFYLK